jgi:hypothetical protein
LNHIDILGKAHALLPLHLAFEAELDILGRQFAKPLVKLHPLPQGEGPDRAIVGHGPTLGEIGLDARRPDLAVLRSELGETSVDEPHGLLGLRENARMGIKGILFLRRNLQNSLPGGVDRIGLYHHDDEKRRQSGDTQTCPGASRHAVFLL